MNARNIGLGFMAVILAACASPMTEQGYRDRAAFAGQFERCHQANYIDANLHAQTLQAFNLNLSTWSYDQQKFLSMAESYYRSARPNQQSCSYLKTEAYKLIAGARQYQASQQAANQSLYQAQQSSYALYQQSMQSLQQQQMQFPTPGAGFSTNSSYKPQPFYPSNSCFGTVVNGICQGTINPSVAPKCCHGTVINGICKGTVVNGPC